MVNSLEKYLGDKINRIWELIGCVCMTAQNWESKKSPGVWVAIAACRDGPVLPMVPCVRGFRFTASSFFFFF